MSHWKFLEAFIKIYFFRVSAEWLTLNIGFDFMYPFCLVLNSLASGIRFIVYFLNERFFPLPSSDSIQNRKVLRGHFVYLDVKCFMSFRLGGYIHCSLWISSESQLVFLSLSTYDFR